ncbi:MAG: hypothetical protein ACM3NN_13305 [Nitrospirota bacterium]
MIESSALRLGGASSVWARVTPVVAVASGAKTLLHEVSTIAAKEKAEMRMIEFFISERNCSLTAADIQSQSALSRKASSIVTETISSRAPMNAAGNILGDGWDADFVEGHAAFWASSASPAVILGLRR